MLPLPSWLCKLYALRRAPRVIADQLLTISRSVYWNTSEKRFAQAVLLLTHPSQVVFELRHGDVRISPPIDGEGTRSVQSRQREIQPQARLANVMLWT